MDTKMFNRGGGGNGDSDDNGGNGSKGGEYKDHSGIPANQDRTLESTSGPYDLRPTAPRVTTADYNLLPPLNQLLRAIRSGQFGSLKWSTDSVPAIACPGCGHPRYDDGTRCVACGIYARRDIQQQYEDWVRRMPEGWAQYIDSKYNHNKGATQ